MTMPNFLVIGAAKCGTTSLYQYLKQHPQIYVTPIKETNFFALDGQQLDFRGPGDQEAKCRFSITDVETYRAQFQGVTTEKALGEVCPAYLYSPRAPERIQHHVPHAKLIAVLRNPVERAYSSYLMAVRVGRERLDFARALQEEPNRIQNKWGWGHYVSMGFYYTQLKRYFDRFDPRQIKIYLFEDLSAGPLGILKDIFRFLEVDEAFAPDVSVRHNVTGIPRSRVLRVLNTRLFPLKEAVKPFLPVRVRQLMSELKNRDLVKLPLAPEMRKKLIEVYREEITKLQGLIQKDLSSWLT
ncbi:MAG: sulfotransferase [Candidatus Fraserbacteria bacterium RBG_16_55_9]|uniref:Sulfotransferase n=1 Tax=Fraserbacteria sp. (strain RBG_16_55_9) TaxID=1817864 RepID=A0A1F5UR16_FRAXR|nr:MAG: sulfotransferase [Candidatus Fraserbacteria bacterium RBG_16_55_9]